MLSFLYKLFFRFLLHLPDGFFSALFIIAYPIYKFLHLNRAYGRVQQHLIHTGMAFDPKTKKGTTPKEIFKGIYWSAIDSYRVLVGIPSALSRVTIENPEILEEALKEGPAVAMSIHQGSFEILHRILCDFGPKVHVITNPIHDDALTKSLEKIRRHKNLEQYPMGNPNAVPNLIRNLFKTKGILAMLVDQSREGKGNRVEIFGEPSTLYLRLPLRANKMGASIVTFHTFYQVEDFGRYQEKRIVVRFEKCYPAKMAASAEGETQIINGISQEVENWIRENPEVWCWNYHKNFLPPLN